MSKHLDVAKQTHQNDGTSATGANPRLILPVLLSAIFMAQFDLYVVNVAVPSLQHSLQANQAELELIVAGYAFTYASGLITGGRLGDLFGHRKIFLIGTIAFAFASLLCGIALSPDQLIAARLLQGLTGAAMVPQVLAMITANFPPSERPRALSWFGAVTGLGAVAGQVVGGLLLQINLFGLDWRIIFLVNVPIGLLTVVFGLPLLPPSKSASRPRIDPVGTVGIAGSLALVLVPLVLGPTAGWPTWTWICIIAAIPVMIVALLWERALAQRGGQPLLDLALFNNSSFSRGLIVNVGVYTAFFGFLFTLTLVLQLGLKLTPLQAGLTFTPLGIAFALCAIASQRITRKYGARMITFGTVVAAIGVLALFLDLQFSGVTITALKLIPPMVLIGAGNGLTIPALIGAVLSGIQPQQAGSASGVLTTAQQFASAIGVATLGAIFFQVLAARAGISAYSSALEAVALVDLFLVVIVAGMSLLLPRPARQPKTEPSPTPAPALSTTPSLGGLKGSPE